MEQRTKVTNVNAMGLPYLEKIYCFMQDIEEASQAFNSDDVLLGILSTNAIRFPAIIHIMSNYQETDWRECPIKDLVALGIINCKGVNIPIGNYPGAQSFEGIDLGIRDRSKFTDFLKSVEIAYKSKSVAPTSDSNKIDPKAIPSRKEQDEILYAITFDDMKGEVLLNDKIRLSKPNFGTENEVVMGYLISHPNKKITKKEIQEEQKITIGKDFHKIVENLGFTGPLKDTFFRISASCIIFRNPIRKDDFNKLGISPLNIR